MSGQPTETEASTVAALRTDFGLLMGYSFGVGATLFLLPMVLLAAPIPFFALLFGGFVFVLLIACIFGILRVVGSMSDEIFRPQRRVSMKQIRKAIIVLLFTGLCFAAILSTTVYLVFTAVDSMPSGQEFGMLWAGAISPFFAAMILGHPLAKWFWFRYEVPTLGGK